MYLSSFCYTLLLHMIYLCVLLKKTGFVGLVGNTNQSSLLVYPLFLWIYLSSSSALQNKGFVCVGFLLLVIYLLVSPFGLSFCLCDFFFGFLVDSHASYASFQPKPQRKQEETKGVVNPGNALASWASQYHRKLPKHKPKNP